MAQISASQTPDKPHVLHRLYLEELASILYEACHARVPSTRWQQFLEYPTVVPITPEQIDAYLSAHPESRGVTEPEVSSLVDRALAKLKQQVPDRRPYVKIPRNSVATLTVQYAEQRIHFVGDGPDLAQQFEWELDSMSPSERHEFESELEAGTKDSMAILDEYPDTFKDTNKIKIMLSRLKTVVDHSFMDTQKMFKLLVDYGGFQKKKRIGTKPQGGYTKDEIVTAYRKVLETFYPLEGDEYTALLLFRAHKAGFPDDAATAELLSDMYVMGKPIEFLGKYYFDTARVKRILAEHLPNANQPLLPLHAALRIIREEEVRQCGTAYPYRSRDLLDQLPRYSLSPKNGPMRDADGLFVCRADIVNSVTDLLASQEDADETALCAGLARDVADAEAYATRYMAEHPVARKATVISAKVAREYVADVLSDYFSGRELSATIARVLQWRVVNTKKSDFQEGRLKYTARYVREVLDRAMQTEIDHAAYAVLKG